MYQKKVSPIWKKLSVLFSTSQKKVNKIKQIKYPQHYEKQHLWNSKGDNVRPSFVRKEVNKSRETSCNYKQRKEKQKAYNNASSKTVQTERKGVSWSHLVKTKLFQNLCLAPFSLTFIFFWSSCAENTHQNRKVLYISLILAVYKQSILAVYKQSKTRKMLFIDA